MKKTTITMLCLAACFAAADTKITWLADVTADRAETVTGVQSNQIANAVPYTGANRTVNIGNNDLVVSNSVFVGDDVVVDGHIEVDGRIDLIGTGRYITGASYVSGLSVLEGLWQTSDRAVSGETLYLVTRATVEESTFYTDNATNVLSAKLDLAALRTFHYGSPDIVESPAEWFAFDGAGTITAFNWAAGRTNVVIPWAIGGVPVTAIGANAFVSSGIMSLIAPQTVTLIENFAFSGCGSLASVSLPQVQAIWNEAFYSCFSLAFVSLPQVEAIGDNAFYYCISLTSVYFNNDAPTIGYEIFENITPNQVTIYVTNPHATGWAATFGGMPVVRLPLYADAIYQAGELVATTQHVAQSIAAPYTAWTGTITPANGTATVTVAHGNMPVLVTDAPCVLTLDPTGYGTSGVSRVSLSYYPGANSFTFATDVIQYAETPTVDTGGWNTLLIRRVSNGAWKGVGL